MKVNFDLLARRNAKLAKGKWIDELGKQHLQSLKSLTEDYGFAVAMGDLLLLEGKWYVTHAGLLRLAARSRCHGIQVQQVRDFCDPLAGRWVFKASVYKSPKSKGFVGYGDADPSNVSPVVRGAELRIAETRAVNRALRKAYGSASAQSKSWVCLRARQESPLFPCRRTGILQWIRQRPT